jgi:hypothetical protein
VAGGNFNRIRRDSYQGTIGGGNSNLIDTNSRIATISGGWSNWVGTNTDYAVIGGGMQNNIQQNTTGAAVLGGYHNVIAPGAHFAAIPGGNQARADHHGQVAHAAGAFADPGDAQASRHVLRNLTIGTVTNELFLDGVGGTRRLTVPDNTAWAFDILIIGRTSGANSAGYHLRGTIENSSGTTTLEGTPLKDVLNEDVTAWDVAVEADNVHDALVVKVIGSSPHTARWVAEVRTVEVTFP